MASRAFFRCRACGEPVVAGAYRCPNCGIDFPTGTSGAPFTPDSPAVVDPARSDRRFASTPDGDDAGSGAAAERASPQPGELSVELIAARLEGALDAELAPPPPIDQGSAEDDRDLLGPPGTPRAGQSPPRADAGILDAAPGSLASASGSLGAVVSERGAGGEPGRADLTLAPARDRANGPTRGERRGVVPALPESTALVPVRRRRNKAWSLVSTTLLAVGVLVAIAGAGLWMDRNRIVDLGLTGRSGPTPGAPLSIEADAGWVAVPATAGTVAISADGPYRIRLDGVVYTLDRGQTLRVPVTEGVSLAVRTVRAPTVALVTVEPVP